MSFSSEIKTELCALPISDRALALAECYGVLLYCHTFTPRELRIVTASADFAARLPKLFKRAFGITLPEPGETGRGRQVFHTEYPALLSPVLDAIGLDPGRSVSHHINLGVLEEQGATVAFLRGAFLAGGSVTDPMKGFHLEFATAHYSVSREAEAILSDLGYPPNSTRRSGSYMLYYKRAEVIADVLTMLGADTSSLRIVEAQVERSMNNKVNRQINCDSANADKVVAAAQEQLDAILRIQSEYGLAVLPEKLQDAALLRIANPEASLADLAKLSYPAVSKSTLSYRLKKILEFDPKKG